MENNMQFTKDKQEPLADYMRRVSQYSDKVIADGDELTKRIAELNYLAADIKVYNMKVQNEKECLHQDFEEEKTKQHIIAVEKETSRDELKKLEIVSDETEKKTKEAVEKFNEHLAKTRIDEINRIEKLLENP